MDISTIINVVTTQCRRYYINLLMNVFAIMNVSNTQQHWYCDIFSMRVLYIINALMGQLGTSCSFDSPGLARNEPTPGERSQGDSTP
ncbi:tetrahydrofolate synthase [Segatella salivae]|uniref:tetrahydrofolate synthase n=1 Tax=Segatella salivae TaxID=228604 RepID=UPI00352E9857